ncbi:MAG: FAD-binding oxidoreductase [Deltaproteobacteria bacterium]|nr:MAG: FAD-binding oxidoreductase [Deltaproteobacteria bacterium]
MTFVVQTPKEGRPRAGGIEEQRRRIADTLREIVGERWVSIDPAILDTYAWQYLAEAVQGTHYMPRPLAVVLPANTEEVAAVVRACNDAGVQFKALSTGFGMWNAASQEDAIVQIDLRRLDRIVSIDARNMFAVIEPYVTGNQLQSEAMKVGLNTHIAGCGAQCSVLASATSVMGQGMDGISMGFSNRNLLGFEWVTPTGEIVEVGAFDAAGDDFIGDGPGFSIRGIIRGFAGAFGGLGVFTRCAVKLYPWDGPEHLECEGASPNYFMPIPEHHTAAVLLVNDWEGMAELGYAVGEAEIASHLTRNAPSLLAAALSTDNNEAADLYTIPMIHELYYALITVMTAKHAEEARYKRRVMREIVKSCGGGWLSNDLSPAGIVATLRFMRTILRQVGARRFLASLPGFVRLLLREGRRYGWHRTPEALPALIYQSVVRAGMNMRGVFRFAGTFWTAMGSLVTWDNAIRGAKVGAQVKEKYIREGAIVDDGGDNAWGGLYEGGLYAHLEELAMYDQTDPASHERIGEYVIETNLACIEHHCGDSLNAVGPPAHALFSPVCMNYDTFTQRIKAAFDPKNASEASVYTDPDFTPSERMQEQMAAVMANRAPVVLDE